MSDKDSIYIQYGRFRAGATGKIAVTFFVLLIAGIAAMRLLVGW